MAIDRITVRGARQHNLKNIDVEIPRNKLTVITGLSGSGKSSLAFDTIYAEGQRVMILAPIVRGRKGEFKKELAKLASDGFIRARIDGELRSLDEEIRLDKRRNHSIEAVVDRLLIKPGINDRLGESIRTALKLTNGAVLVSIIDGNEKLYSEKMACVNCGINVPPLEPRSFSFNSAYGACRHCHGLGTVLEVDPAKLITNENESPEQM